MIYLSSDNIFKLGSELSENLIKNKLLIDNTLTIKVDEESFKKIDEDLYYRNNKDGEGFEPSFSNITIKFPHLNIIIEK